MNRHLNSLAAGLVLGTLAVEAAAADNPLTQERWRTRPLIVVAPAADDPLLARLDAEMRGAAQQAAFAEREMVLYRLVPGAGFRNGLALTGAQTAALVRTLGVDPAGPATVLLVGKDGSIKLRADSGVSLSELFSTIDQMPMRRR